VGAGHFRKAQDILETIFGSKLAEINERNKRKELLAGQNDEVCEADDVNEDLETSPRNPRLSPTLDEDLETSPRNPRLSPTLDLE
jgi:hypothetical protein